MGRGRNWSSSAYPFDHFFFLSLEICQGKRKFKKSFTIVWRVHLTILCLSTSILNYCEVTSSLVIPCVFHAVKSLVFSHSLWAPSWPPIGTQCWAIEMSLVCPDITGVQSCSWSSGTGIVVGTIKSVLWTGSIKVIGHDIFCTWNMKWAICSKDSEQNYPVVF